MRHATTLGSWPRHFTAPRVLCMVLCASLALGLGLGFAAPTAHAGAAPNRLDNNGGRVLQHPEIHNLFLDSNWDGDNPAALSQANINNFTSQLVSSNYFAKAGQYGVTSPTFTGSNGESILCPAPIINHVTDFVALLAWISTCETAPSPVPFLTLTGVPSPNDNTLYVLYLPTGASIIDPGSQTCQNYTAYHFMSNVPAWQVTFVPPFVGIFPQNIAFAVVPASCANGSLDTLTENASHEIIEASTDPTVLTGRIDNSTASSLGNILKAGEAADICEPGTGAVPTPPVRLTDGLLVAPYWSNADGMCEPITRQIHLAETGLPNSVPHAATFDGGSVTLPFSTVVDDGTTHSYSFPTPVNDPNPGIRYVTTTPPATNTNVTSDVSVTAAYTTQVFLTVQATPAEAAAGDTSLTPSAWEAQGSTVSLTTDALVALGGGHRERFDHWSGDASGTSATTTILMDAPKTATANYVSQHLLTVNTSGLGANITTITNGATTLGTANDSTPLAVWLDDGPLALGASADVNGAAGTQYFFQGFTPAAPATLSGAFTTTAGYKTMAQLVSDALAGGGISGPGAAGLANSYTQEFAAVQADIAAGDTGTGQALTDLRTFICHVDAQAGKKVTSSLATTLVHDATLVYTNLGGTLPIPAC